MIQEVIEQIVARNPRQRAPMATTLASLEDDERRDLEAWIAHAMRTGEDSESLAEAYDTVVRDTLREQLHFRREGRYRHSSFTDVAGSVYFSSVYMRRYMLGLALTGFLWENHLALRRFVLGALAELPRVGRYLEVGPGHGLNLAAAARLDCAAHFEAIDLSPTSVALSRELLASGTLGPLPEVEIRVDDFLEASIVGLYGVVVMGEILEHVERPLEFLRRAQALLEPAGHLILTTCIDAPAIDHIWHFASVDEVERLIEQAGLVLEKRCVLPHPGLSLSEAKARKMPINVGFVAGQRAIA